MTLTTFLNMPAIGNLDQIGLLFRCFIREWWRYGHERVFVRRISIYRQPGFRDRYIALCSEPLVLGRPWWIEKEKRELERKGALPW
jgi:hypothetical protein